MKFILTAGYKISRLINKIFKPTTVGVRAIIVNEKNEVLLVKQTYMQKLFFPGGKIKKGETHEIAVKRELAEEVGYIPENIELFGVYNNFLQGKNDSVVVFICKKGHFTTDPKSFEIDYFNFYDILNLPEDISTGTQNRINEYLNNDLIRFGIW